MLKTITISIAYNLYKKRNIGNFKFISSDSDENYQTIVFEFHNKYYRFYVANNFSTVDTVESYEIPLCEYPNSKNYHVYVDCVNKMQKEISVTYYI
jgi:hypothetical protein